MGRILFYLLWPLVWVYAPLRLRVRVRLVHKGEVLFVKNWFGPNIWQLPGGGVKFFEQPVDAAIREIKEELGYALDANDLEADGGPQIVKWYGLTMRYQYFDCHLQQKPEIHVGSDITAFKWRSEQ